MFTQYSYESLEMMQQGNGGLAKKGSTSIAGKKKRNKIKKNLEQSAMRKLEESLKNSNKKPKLNLKNLDKSTKELNKKFNESFNF